ncbi:membrane protein [Candidatus Magnetomorum sp. HK-1]|nr:membrane protein [Candidatus Magnetomorum sp. HK-1]
MQFANQAISYFVSGFLCFFWMFLPVFGIEHVRELIQNLPKPIDSNLVGVVGLFFIFPFSYALGNAINAVANWGFSRKDQQIRDDVLSLIKKISKKSVIQDDIDKIKTFVTLEKDNEIFNFYRFKFYKSGAELYDFFGFHREIIRILRATSLNAFMVFLALFTIWDCLYLRLFGYCAMAAFLAIIIVSKGKAKIDPLGWISNKYGFLIITFGLFLIIPISIIFSITHPELYYIGGLFLFISSLSCIAWEKQQEDFYLSMIRAHLTDLIQ